MANVYTETYRGISFHQTHKGYWVFGDVPYPGGSWHHFMTDCDVHAAGRNAHHEDAAPALRRTIDNFRRSEQGR